MLRALASLESDRTWVSFFNSYVSIVMAVATSLNLCLNWEYSINSILTAVSSFWSFAFDLNVFASFSCNFRDRFSSCKVKEKLSLSMYVFILFLSPKLAICNSTRRSSAERWRSVGPSISLFVKVGIKWGILIWLSHKRICSLVHVLTSNGNSIASPVISTILKRE